ncbi:MAG TPA: lamin tail domain-containing protein [Verrucomicrobiae bacterium]|nr:lamin tail domain-containing protein [Verrucomicrobiae bacterium]
MKSVRCLVVVGFLCFLTTTLVRAQDSVRINEFMAINDHGLDDEDGDEEDWIEIYNPGPASVNLAGWSLTDTTNNMQKWVFPPVTIASNAYLIVFASEKNRNVGQLHTNFKLDGDGEYLALVRSNGTVATEFAPKYPAQAPDIAYGVRGSTSQETLLAPGAPVKALVPTSAALEPPPGPTALRPWTLDDLNDSGWQSGFTGVGFEANTGYESLLALSVTNMYQVNETVYIRIPFRVDNPATISALTLRMRFDDGFIAYINGHPVAWDNAPDPSTASWTNGAPANRDDGTAVVPANYNITPYLGFVHVGTNMLAIQGLNNGAASSDLLILPEILATVTGTATFSYRYFTLPSPGEANNAGVPELGPIIDDEDHHPKIPTDNDALRITARIRPTRGAVASATLYYRTNFGPIVSVPLLDDGNSGDEGSDDGVYGAIIPANAHRPGQMVRWYITATDTFGGTSRMPLFAEPLGSPEYLGTIVHDPSLTNPLPILHWFIQNPAAAETAGGTRCSLFYDGEFYDNLGINIHGQSSQGFPKKSFDIDLHPGHNFKWKEGEPRADDINLLTTYPDKAHMRNILSYLETYREADSAYHWVLPVRVQQNGLFWGTAHIVENGDEDWLFRMGLNTQGALYKMYNQFNTTGSATSGAEKKTRKFESNADLTALYNGVNQTGEARRRFAYDNIDVAQTVDYLAARALTGDTDCCHKNYYLYRDTGQSDEWVMWAWDVDLSFGRVWTTARSYWEQILNPTTPLFIGSGNKFDDAIFGTPEMRQMYLRRVRTLMDELLKPAGTPLEQLHYEPRIDELLVMLRPDALLDAAKWGSHAWGNGSTAPCCPQFIDAAVAEMRDSYLPARRNALFGKTSAASATELPDAQPYGTIINFGTSDVNPAGGNQDQEYIQLQNPNAIAVDISGWVLSGAVSFVFRGGTVIPAGANLYVAANRKAFRARATGPSGNQSLHVVGDYNGRLSARGESLQLMDRQGVIVATVNTLSNPSPAQASLRITEIMYHPPALPGDTFPAEEYEYIELRNIGTSTLNLAGVHFSEGIFFSFTGSSITSLAAGEKVLVVKNRNAFTQRYGATAAARVAGAYTDIFGGPGSLDNGGERLRLDDATNEKILEFDYNNSWYPITDGRGFSLVIKDWTAPFQTWDLKTSWRPSGHEYGTPAADDTALPAVPGILVNEVLANTDAPQKDSIELFNPTALAVDVSNWYITDDPGTPKKYRIPAGRIIPSGGYAVFDENDFNPTPGTPPSFSFSSLGDEAYIFSGNAAGELTGYHHGYSFEASGTGVPFGRYIDSRGLEHFVAMAAFTPVTSNSAPKVGPVVISEINYHPPQKPEGIDFVEAFEDEYIEVRNITGSPVQLFDPTHTANTWRIRGGVDYDFPPDTTIPANGQLVIVSFSPDFDAAATSAFRARHGLSPSVALLGPFTGRLSNDGDDLRLRRLDPPDAASGEVPSVLIDSVTYDDDPPWPIAADGFGPSLQRKNLAAFGNDPINWTAATKTPGSPYPGGNPPVITDQPDDQRVVASSTATFSVTASGDPLLRYQWTFNGDLLRDKTNATLSIQNVKASQQGAYRVLVLNNAGSLESSNAVLTVLIPARIIQQPQNTQAHLGGTAIFVVQASSSTPMTYQWRKGGVALPGRTDSFLRITNVAQSDAGSYDVVITDDVGPITSDAAQLTVLVNPIITTQPAGQNVTVAGAPLNVSFTVAATSGTPLRYQWYFNNNVLAASPNIFSVTNSTLTISNVNLSHTGDYQVIVRDNFGAATSVVARLTVNSEPVYASQPITQVVPEGGIATFSAAWNGSGPFLHRWLRSAPSSINFGFIFPTGFGRIFLTNGYIIATQTNSVLVLTNIGTNMAGTYRIVVSNAVNQVGSSNVTLTVVADADHDGLPDSWETGRTGFNPNDPTDALRDDDGDGVNNAREYFAGTDYLDRNSYLKTTIVPSGNTLLNFAAVSNRNYIVQYSETLLPGQWTNLMIEPGKSSNRVVTVTDPALRAKRYYRLVTPAQP